MDRTKDQAKDWETLAGDGSIRHFTLDVDHINADFKSLGDPRSEEHVEPGPGNDAYIDLWVALVSQPSIGKSLLGDNGFRNLQAALKEGDEAILVAGNGRWSFKGSGYVRGGIFDRIQVIQGEISNRFHDRDHLRMNQIAADGAPAMKEATSSSSARLPASIRPSRGGCRCSSSARSAPSTSSSATLNSPTTCRNPISLP